MYNLDNDADMEAFTDEVVAMLKGVEKNDSVYTRSRGFVVKKEWKQSLESNLAKNTLQNAPSN